MNHKRKLIELAAKADGTVKELGLLPTRNRPEYDEAGNFNGMRESVDGTKTVAGAVGTLGVAGGAVAANSAIQGSFGGQGVESWKQAGRYGVNEAKVAASGLYNNNSAVRTGRAFVKRKGRGLIAGLGKIAARLKGFDSKVRIKELAAAAESVVHELASPIGEFNQTHREHRRGARTAFRAARQNYKDSQRGGIGDPVMDAAREKLNRESHVRVGAGVGAGVGAVAAPLGVLRAARGMRGGLKSKIGHAVLLAPAGAILGAGLGVEVGGRIRKKAA